MKALSIQQPWAWAILHAGKDVENRTWSWPRSIPLPCRIVIHTGQQVDYDGYRWLQQSDALQLPELLSISSLPKGCLVGEVTVFESRLWTPRDRGSAWAFGPYCWLLKDPVIYPEPIPYRGQLGVFEVDVSS